MKKWLIAILSIVMGSMLLAGCASDKKASAGEGKQTEKQKEFHFAMSGLYKPFNFKENGQLVGFDVEIGQALADKMNMKAVPVTNPWETIIQGLISKKYDAILGSMAITPEREQTVSFTTPYYNSGAQIFVANTNNSIKSVEDLKGKKLGVLKASTFKELATKQTDKITEYDSDLTALMDLPSGRVDAVITDDLVGFRMMKESSVAIKEIGEPLTLSKAGIAVRKEDKELLDKLNKALADIIKDGTYEKISQKWFGKSILRK
ncbi:ABC transporter substrate-binding protein [Paenibacillus sp. MBLB4367]|uniref:ABC transporter substrate-binding protein n=1 Tax=Paenibacillus sp. MBLB4367 TaxID=3384767 RepID=UPI003907EEC1